VSETSNPKQTDPGQRCSGPNCGVFRRPGEQWWLMWLTYRDGAYPVLSLCP
jgi:hypothetical protein